MKEQIQIQGTELQVKEYEGKRVITFKDIDTVHQRPEGTASRNFRTNRQRFISGVDFYNAEITNDEFRRQFDVGKNAGRTVTLITESGYLMLVKSFTDNLAWKVQRDLVDTYFRVKEESPVEEPNIRVSLMNPEIFLEAARIMASVPDSKQNVINCLRHIVPDIDREQKIEVQLGDSTVGVPVMEDKVLMIETTIDRSYSTPFNSAQFNNYLLENNIKLYWLATELGCAVTCISKWRYGNTRPKIKNRIKLCEILGLPMEYIDGLQTASLTEILIPGEDEVFDACALVEEICKLTNIEEIHIKAAQASTLLNQALEEGKLI